MSGQVNNGAMSQAQGSHKHCHTLGPSTCPPFTVFLGPGLVLLSVRFELQLPTWAVTYIFYTFTAETYKIILSVVG